MPIHLKKVSKFVNKLIKGKKGYDFPDYKLTNENSFFFGLLCGVRGAGKTNACHAMASAASTAGWPARVLEEPTNHPKFNHFLSHYYDDLRTGTNTGGGFAMQMFMLCQRYEQHRLAV